MLDAANIPTSDSANGAFEHLSPVTKNVIVDDVRDVLRDAIVSGRIAQGYRINETILSRQLDLSRGPIREALAGLENEGLVTRVVNKGMFVVQFTLKDVEELYELRTMYELYALRYTFAHSRSFPIAAMEGILDEFRQPAVAGPDAEQITARIDLRFHAALIEASGLQRLTAAWGTLAPQWQMILTNRNKVNPDFVATNVAAHETIIAVLKSGDSTASVQTLRKHIEAGYLKIIEDWA